jgi:hypothetical protein
MRNCIKNFYIPRGRSEGKTATRGAIDGRSGSMSDNGRFVKINKEKTARFYSGGGL